MFLILFIATILTNVQFTKNEAYTKCVSEKTESAYCKKTIAYVEFEKIKYADLGN